MGFVWSDAWVLLSVIYAQKPADRERITATGDYLNHAIMTQDELEGGLRRLSAAGYVSEESTGCVLGSAGAVVAAAVKRAGADSQTWALLEEFAAVEVALGVVSPWA